MSVAKAKADYQPSTTDSIILKKVKVEGNFIYPQCTRRNGKRVCKPKGKTYKFRSYSYMLVDDETPVPKGTRV